MELEFDERAKLSQILEKIQNSSEEKIELRVAENALVLQNAINKEIIKRFATDVGKSVNFGEAAVVETPATTLEEADFVEGQDIAALGGQSAAESAITAVAPVVHSPEEKHPVLPLVRKLPKFPLLNKISRKWLLIGGAAIAVLVGVFVFLWSLPAAEVTLFYESSSQAAKSTVTAVVNGGFDASAATIGAKTDEVTKADLASGKATGKKTVGEAAKGRVTINNSSTVQDRFFVKGTVLTPTGGGITFTTDEDVTATKSASPGTYGKTGVNVTATKSGPEGNYAAGTIFKVGSISDTGIVFAQNDTAFSGGTTKTVTIVSDADRKSLRDQLVQKLTQKATEEIKTKNSSSVIPDGSVETSVSKETYDKGVGEEATDFSLSMEIVAKGIFLAQADLVKVLSQNMVVSPGLKVDETNSKVSAKVLQKSPEGYKIEGSINAILIPDIDRTRVVKKLAGQRLADAGKYLVSLPGVSRYTIKFNPNFYASFGFLPFSADKISVRLEEAQK